MLKVKQIYSNESKKYMGKQHICLMKTNFKYQMKRNLKLIQMLGIWELERDIY